MRNGPFGICPASGIILDCGGARINFGIYQRWLTFFIKSSFSEWFKKEITKHSNRQQLISIKQTEQSEYSAEAETKHPHAQKHRSGIIPPIRISAYYISILCRTSKRPFTGQQQRRLDEKRETLRNKQMWIGKYIMLRSYQVGCGACARALQDFRPLFPAVSRLELAEELFPDPVRWGFSSNITITRAAPVCLLAWLGFTLCCL